MERLVTSNLKLGIIAGGQLGKMLIQEASKWDISTFVLDPDENCPAAPIASAFIKGDYLDFNDVYNFGKQVDVLTYELENINTDALRKLKADGIKVEPSPDILEMIQDKGQQKKFYRENNIPTADYALFPYAEAIKEALQRGSLKYPFVQKLRKGGYDGRGVSVIRNEKDLDGLLDGPSVVEKLVRIRKEISVVVARNARGQVRCFPTVEMVFDKKANLVEKLICPSTVSPLLSAEAKSIAGGIIEKLDMSGLLAVEFFVDEEGQLLVNEMAPRPHNSGHHTIESVITSQFEQHLRAILNLPLGSTKLKMPSVMLNIVGAEGHEGNVVYEGLTESMAMEGVKIHLYGKKITKPYRKMGHVTILASELDDAILKADEIKRKIKVKAWK